MRMRLRLKGEVGDAVRTFVLPLGEAKVGSAPANEVVLPVMGVSRHHALLRPADGALEVSDLESKNGVYVNGTRVSSATLAPGDDVRFGPATLRLEAVDEQDVELAVVLGPDPAARPSAEDTSRATATWAGGDSPEWLPILDQVVPLLRSGAAGLGSALAILVEEAGLQGCCMVEIRDGAPLIMGAAGSLAGLEEACVEATRAASAPSPLSSGTMHGAPDLFWAAVAGAPGRILLAWRRPGTPSVEPALRILVQIAAWADLTPAPPATASSVRRPLVFPVRHVRGTAPGMVELYGRMEPIADTSLPVLVIGETGVGKEDFARALHLSSARARGPFVAVNCAAIPADLLEAELFGVGKGAATGVAARPGRFQVAHGGTLFLDEIGDMSLGLQAKLLRVLETGEVEPLAAPAVRVDLRIVSATNVDLASRMDNAQFRADLFYRLCGAVLRIPPLRERRGDIPGLVDGLLRPLAVASGKPIRGVTGKALAALVDYDWPGNVRELGHELQRLLHGCLAGEAIEYGMLRDEIRAPRPRRELAAADSLELQRHVDALEERLIKEALTRTGGNRTEAARLLGVSRNGLALKMTRLGLDG
jgi:transcriptional regulator with AAA-type ATPase domain